MNHRFLNNWRLWVRTAALCLLGTFVVPWCRAAGEELAKPAVSNPEMCPAAGDAAITNFLVSLRKKYDLPAIAAAQVTGRGLVAVGVAGVRKRGTDIPATLDDQWHLGSECKAMTATLVARLVEKGSLKWDTTVAQVFPDLAPGFNFESRRITVLQLLSHRAGLKPNPDLSKYAGEDGRAERLRLVKDELAQPPTQKLGTRFEYSNLGYCIAGAITEKLTGKTWEQAMRDEVFTPLDMTSVGFGGTGTPGKIDQPWGHVALGLPAIGNGPAIDNPPVLSPAGRVHCTIQDWAKFIADQLKGDEGGAGLLKPESYQVLHRPPFGGDYALGWMVVDRDWGGGKVLHHGGDNTMNFASVWAAPLRDFAVLVCINQSGNTAFRASDEAMGPLMQPFLKDTAADGKRGSRKSRK